MDILRPNILKKNEIHKMKKELRTVVLLILLFLVLLNVIAFLTYLIIGLAEGLHFAASYDSVVAGVKKLDNYTAFVRPMAFFISYVLSITITLLVAAKRDIKLFSGLFSRPQTGAGDIAIFGVAHIGLTFLISLVLGVILNLLVIFKIYFINPDFTIPLNSSAGTATMCFTIVIIGPIAEEILFRGFLLRCLNRYSSRIAVIGSALLWAMYHGNLIQTIPIFFIGILLAVLALKSRSILPTIILHVIYNGVIMSMQLINNTDRFMISMLGIAEVLLIVLAIVFLSAFREHFRVPAMLKTKNDYVSFKTFFSSIPVIIMLVLSLVLIAHNIRIS